MTGLFNIWSERQDLNLRPLHPQCSALPDCATPRWTAILLNIRNFARGCMHYPAIYVAEKQKGRP